MFGIGKNEKIKGHSALLLCAFLFASMGIFVRFLQVDFTILQQVYLRIFLAMLFTLLIFSQNLDFGKLWKISRKEWLVLGIRAVSMCALAIPLVSYAFTIGKYGNMAFLQAVPFGAVLGFLLLHESVTKKKILYVLVAFVGVVLVSIQDYSSLFSWGIAEVFSIASCFLFSFGYITRKWHSTLLTNQEISVLIFFIATVCLVATSLFIGEGLPPIPTTNIVLISLIAAALFNVFIAVLSNYGFQKVPAVIASNILTLEVVFSLLFAVFLYQEIPSMKELLGGVCIIVSVYQMNKLS